MILILSRQTNLSNVDSVSIDGPSLHSRMTSRPFLKSIARLELELFLDHRFHLFLDPVTILIKPVEGKKKLAKRKAFLGKIPLAMTEESHIIGFWCKGLSHRRKKAACGKTSYHHATSRPMVCVHGLKQYFFGSWWKGLRCRCKKPTQRLLELLITHLRISLFVARK